MAVRVEHPFFGKRLAIASAITCFAVFSIIIRLWYLQCIRGAYFRDLSENNRTRTVRTLPPRGNILDREGRVIVRNRPAFNIAIMLEDAPNINYTLTELAEITGRDRSELSRQIASFKRHQPFQPLIVLPDVSYEELAKIKVNTYRLPGISVQVSPTRAYPFLHVASHMLGYAREVTKSQLEDLNVDSDRYSIGDIVGQAGVERQYENELSGTSGFVQVEVDAMGNRKGELGIMDSKPGNDLYLTIDLDLQNVLDKALEGKRGAGVVLDPRNGEILAIASAPAFDANIFSGQMSGTDWQKIAQDKFHPMKNRAVGEIYPAGSTFKLILATAALAEGKITPATTFNCPGYFMFAGRPYHCHKHSGHGTVDLAQALTVSCNSYFYQVGQLLGVEGIHKYATMLGLGTLSGIELPGEKQGVIPSEEWKLKTFGQRWYPGETVSVSIGQGYVAVTPMQMAIAMSTIANGGTVYKPRLLKKIVRSESGQVEEFGSEVARKLPIDPKVFQQVRDIAVGVVANKNGTGIKAALPGIAVGGKTGTAQVTALGRDSGEDLNDHAWFVAFAPAENPTIALAILVEHGGHGGSASAPISHDIMQTYFRKQGLLPPEIGPQLPPGFQTAQNAIPASGANAVATSQLAARAGTPAAALKDSRRARFHTTAHKPSFRG